MKEDVDWAALTIHAKSSYIAVEDSKEAEVRQKLFSYDDAENYFLNAAIETVPISDGPPETGLSRLF